MSIRIMSQVWSDRSIQGLSDLIVLLAIADYANDEGEAWPGVKSLSEKARCSERTVQRTIQSLVESGKLEVIPGGQGPGSPNHYVVCPTVSFCHPSQKGDNHAVKRVTTATKKGDTAMSPDPSVDPSIDPPSEVEKVLRMAALVIYKAYPKKVARPEALKAIIRKLQAGHEADTILAATQAFAKLWSGAKPDDWQYCAHPATWFNQERYNDDPSTWALPPSMRDRPGAPKPPAPTRAADTCELEGREYHRGERPPQPHEFSDESRYNAHVRYFNNQFGTNHVPQPWTSHAATTKRKTKY